MKYITTQKARIISAAAADDFERKLNQAFQDLKGTQYELRFNDTVGLCAYFIYHETETIPETLKDERELAGDIVHCAECPAFIPIGDLRHKSSHCKYKSVVFREDNACNLYYQCEARGELDQLDHR